jgi:hypothetical protein
MPPLADSKLQHFKIFEAAMHVTAAKYQLLTTPKLILSGFLSAKKFSVTPRMGSLGACAHTTATGMAGSECIQTIQQQEGSNTNGVDAAAGEVLVCSGSTSFSSCLVQAHRLLLQRAPVCWPTVVSSL